MRCQFLLTLLLSCSSAFVVRPATTRPRVVVTAKPPKTGEAVAKKKGIPIALLIWPLLAVGADVRDQCYSSSNLTPRRRRRDHVVAQMSLTG